MDKGSGDIEILADVEENNVLDIRVVSSLSRQVPEQVPRIRQGV